MKIKIPQELWPSGLCLLLSVPVVYYFMQKKMKKLATFNV